MEKATLNVAKKEKAVLAKAENQKPWLWAKASFDYHNGMRGLREIRNSSLIFIPYDL